MKQASIAVLAGGCFWCTEAIFKRLKGVISVDSGYTGGEIINPNYEQVSAGDTGHAEAVRVTFDPSELTYRDILEVFFATHDPTSLNRQGNDIGTQYRSAIFYDGEEQKQTAEAIIQELTEVHAYNQPIVTEVKPLNQFYPAEDYHKNYYDNNLSAPYCSFVIAPKLKKFKDKFASLIKE